MDSVDEIIKKNGIDIDFIRKRNKGNGFTKIPNIFIDNSDLTIFEKMVFIVIKKHMFWKNFCWPSIPTIAKEASCGESSVKKAIKSLKAKKYLEITKTDKIKSNIYKII